MKINTILININISNISLILILCDLIFSNYTINILIELITFLIIQIILKIHYKQNKINYNDFHFGLGVGPTLDLTVHQELYDSPGDSSFKNYVLLTVEKVEDHIDFLKNMVPYHHKHYKISKMTNMENNTTIISGDAPTNINVVNIHCSLEPGEIYVNFFNLIEILVFVISVIFYFVFLSFLVIFLIIKFINFIKFIRFIIFLYYSN